MRDRTSGVGTEKCKYSQSFFFQLLETHLFLQRTSSYILREIFGPSRETVPLTHPWGPKGTVTASSQTLQTAALPPPPGFEGF